MYNVFARYVKQRKEVQCGDFKKRFRKDLRVMNELVSEIVKKQ